jgi:hypothetical protein
VLAAATLPRDGGALGEDRECSGALLASAVGQAAKYQAQGFTNVKVLKGGVEAWKAAGYAMN